MDELLSRYTKEQIKIINDFWETIRWTRSTGKVSDSVKKRELVYWSRFDVAIVIEALSIHINKYPKVREQYVRGIMKNIAYTKGASNRNVTVQVEKPLQNKNRFINFKQRDWDYEAIAYIENLINSGELTEDKITELKNDKRYEKYFT